MNTIKICDVILGGGKSQSAITYMNEHPDKHFVYITPYVDEATRIQEGCPALNFVAPSNRIPTSSFSKLSHTRHLLSSGANIATTHAAFRAYTKDMIDSIIEHEYTLIVDEAVDVFQEVNYSQGDVQLLVDGGYLSWDGDSFTFSGKEYTGTRLADLYNMMKCNNLMAVQKGTKCEYYYWTIPADILNAFSEVFVLTYLFDSSEFRYFMDINKIPYRYIGVSREGDTYRFSDAPDYIPEYTKELRDKVHVFDNPKLNAIGANKNALSVNWLKTHDAERTKLKNNLYNYLHNYNDCGSEEIMWSTFSGNVKALQGRGFASRHVPFNMKAKNEYRNKTVLAYCSNVFISPQKVLFFRQYGIEYDVDGFALSTMIQWIWRSAIRDGKEITIYVPSRRMRELLVDWMDSFVEGGAA